MTAETRRRRDEADTQAAAIKDGNIVLTFPPDGRLPLDRPHGYGLYHHDCRFLSGYEIRIDGRLPQSVEHVLERGPQALVRLVVDGGPPSPPARALPRSGRPVAQGDGTGGELGLGVRWRRRLDGRALALFDTVQIENRADRQRTVDVSLAFDARFEDIFAIRGRRSAGGRRRRPRHEDGDLVLSYTGRDGVERQTRVHVSPEPRWRGTTAELAVPLPPFGGATLGIGCEVQEWQAPAAEHEAGTAGERPQLAGSAHAPAEAAPDGEGDWASIESDSPAFDAIVERARDDLRMLRSELSGRPFYAAGVPWFVALFGRDTLITGLQVLPFERSTTEGTLRLLAERQGRQVNSSRDEQPGRILHELRVGELARTGRVPHGPLYGSIDATPLFLNVLGRIVAWRGEIGLFDELRDAFERALAWIDDFGDLDGDGYVEYLRTARLAPENQGWKDSGDAIVDDRGRLARAPIALVEAQAYVYRAWLEAAGLLRLAGETERATTLLERAEAFRGRVERDFWLPERGSYALALDRDKRPLAVDASNQGHVLWSGLASPAHARTVARRLAGGELFSGWGVRTLSTREAAYAPLGYHVGTVWPHDTAIAVAGLRRYGFDREADRIAGGLLEAAERFPLRRLPEAFAGTARRSGIPPRPYPVANRPQAWAAGSVFHLLHALLGLVPDGPHGRLEVVRPMLPRGVDRLAVRGLGVGSASVDLQFRRGDGSATVEAEVRRGQLDVAVADAWPDPLGRPAPAAATGGGRVRTGRWSRR